MNRPGNSIALMVDTSPFIYLTHREIYQTPFSSICKLNRPLYCFDALSFMWNPMRKSLCHTTWPSILQESYETGPISVRSLKRLTLHLLDCDTSQFSISCLTKLTRRMREDVTRWQERFYGIRCHLTDICMTNSSFH